MFDRTPKTLNFRRNHAVILGPLISRKLLELENRNFRHISMGPNTPFRYEHFSAKGRCAPRTIPIGKIYILKVQNLYFLALVVSEM